jgi:hypothetical protein
MDFLSMKMTSNKKTLNYKVVVLVKSYNFYIKFTSIRVKTKNYKFLKTDWTPTAVARGGSSRYSTARVPNVVGTAVGPSLRPLRRYMYGFAIFWTDPLFLPN